VAARSLAAEGELLCGAASLLVARPSNGPPVAEDVARVEAAARGVAALAGTLDHAGGRAAADLDAAASSRAACLDALTHVRRAAGGAIAGDADALLSELSARGGWAPSRDERGVVVTLRDAWKGVGLTADAERQLKELGRVAGVHPAFLLQVVVHDGAPPGPSERAADSQRAQAALAVLTSSGAAQLSRALSLGAALPVTDPGDPGARARNARLEVVFVSPAE
jgi:hypothetical protein